MKYILHFILIVLFTTNAISESEIETTKFGLVSKSKVLSNFEDARESLSLWIEEIGKELNVNLSVKFYPTSELLSKKFLNNELNMIVLPLPYFLKNKEILEKNSRDYWTLSFSENKFAQYYLISPKNLENKNFKDIKNTTLSYKEDDDIAEIWLDKNSLIENKKSYKKVLKRVLFEEKESTVVLDVFFKKAQFGIVSKKTWDIMIELNPAIAKTIEIVRKSEKIHLPFIGMFSKNSTKKSTDIFFNVTKDMRKLYNSEELLDLLKFDSIFPLELKDLKDLEIYYNEYFKLKKKYE